MTSAISTVTPVLPLSAKNMHQRKKEQKKELKKEREEKGKEGKKNKAGSSNKLLHKLILLVTGLLFSYYILQRSKDPGNQILRISRTFQQVLSPFLLPFTFKQQTGIKPRKFYFFSIQVVLSLCHMEYHKTFTLCRRDYSTPSWGYFLRSSIQAWVRLRMSNSAFWAKKNYSKTERRKYHHILNKSGKNQLLKSFLVEEGSSEENEKNLKV